MEHGDFLSISSSAGFNLALELGCGFESPTEQPTSQGLYAGSHL